MDQITKPITVVRYEFINSLRDLINNSGMPAFIIEPIMRDFYTDVRNLANNQLEADIKAYNDMLAKSNEE